VALRTPLELELSRLIQQHEALGFDQWMQQALYHPDFGFFSSVGEPGKRGKDFLTSPEVGPLFGAVMARAIDGCWHNLGRPDPFVVMEGGAGAGSLAASILRAQPECAGALRYVLVERSPRLRAWLDRRTGDKLPKNRRAGDKLPKNRRAGDKLPDGRVTSLADIPDTPVAHGMVIANELLDNLPFQILELTASGWQEVACCLSEEFGFAESLRPIDRATQQQASQLAPQAKLGDRIPWQRQAAEWVQRALNWLGAGEVLVFDYGDTTAELARRGGWLRTYFRHQRGDSPLVHPGWQDITSDVAFDQLPPLAAIQTQAEFLERWGIAELVRLGTELWQAGQAGWLGPKPTEAKSAKPSETQPPSPTTSTAQPTVDWLIAGSRQAEANILCDPKSFGSYKVASWKV